MVNLSLACGWLPFLIQPFASTLFWVDPVNELTAVLFVQIIPFDNGLNKKFRDAVYGPYKSAEAK